MHEQSVVYYNVPAEQALEQEVKPKGSGLVVSQGQVHYQGTMRTSFLILLASGAIVEIAANQVVIAPSDSSLSDWLKKQAKVKEQAEAAKLKATEAVVDAQAELAEAASDLKEAKTAMDSAKLADETNPTKETKAELVKATKVVTEMTDDHTEAAKALVEAKKGL